MRNANTTTIANRDQKISESQSKSNAWAGDERYDTVTWRARIHYSAIDSSTGQPHEARDACQPARRAN
jgi:hypothetical protein